MQLLKETLNILQGPPLELSQILLDIAGRDTVLLFSPGQASHNCKGGNKFETNNLSNT